MQQKNKLQKQYDAMDVKLKQQLCKYGQNIHTIILSDDQQQVLKAKMRNDLLALKEDNVKVYTEQTLPDDINDIENKSFKIDKQKDNQINLHENNNNTFTFDVYDDNRREQLLIYNKKNKEVFDRIPNIDYTFPSNEFIDAVCKKTFDPKHNLFLAEELKSIEHIKNKFITNINDNLQYIQNNTPNKIKISTMKYVE